MIYFIESQGLVKIGFSVKPELRISKIQSDSPHPCSIIGAMEGGTAEELEVHSKFDYLRHRGEWFRLAPELRTFIENNPFVKQRKSKPMPTDPIGRWMNINRMTDRSLGKVMGVSQSQIHRVRHGKSEPSWGFVKSLYEHTGITPNELMEITENDFFDHAEATQ